VSREGLCTNWLFNQATKHSLIQNNYLATRRNIQPPHSSAPAPFTLPVFIRRGRDFTYPSDVSRPVVMVGPGTGVAPFRGFLHYRQYQLDALQKNASGVGAWRGMDWQQMEEEEPSDDERNAYGHEAKSEAAKTQQALANENEVGDAVLFFGCQRAEKDFLYKEELLAFAEKKTLKALHLAFSRAQKEKVYVQHKMLAAGQDVYDMLVRDNGMLFVCGDGTRMAKDVMQAVHEILKRHGSMSEKDAVKYVAEMMKEKRYIQDIWS
jgi:NADPH-ferrihemoprotein reductase